MDASSQFKDSLPTTPESLLAVLDALAIDYVTHHHPPLRTVEDAKAHRGDMPGIHIKNLYLRDRKKRNLLIVVQEDRVIDLKNLDQKIAFFLVAKIQILDMDSGHIVTIRFGIFNRSQRRMMVGDIVNCQRVKNRQKGFRRRWQAIFEL